MEYLTLNSLTDSGIKEAFLNPRSGEQYENRIKAEFCRMKADWIMSNSISRAVSLKYDTRYTINHAEAVILYYVVTRYLDFKAFQPETYFVLEATADNETITFTWQKKNTKARSRMTYYYCILITIAAIGFGLYTFTSGGWRIFLFGIALIFCDIYLHHKTVIFGKSLAKMMTDKELKKFFEEGYNVWRDNDLIDEEDEEDDIEESKIALEIKN